MTAPAITLAQPRRRRRFSPDTRTALFYLLPAFLVMGVITFYPLLFQTWMSFTDFGLKNLSGKVAPNLVGADNYVQIVQSKLNIPNFEFLRLLFFNLFWAFSNVVIHVILGVGIAILLNTNGLRFKKVYRALFILPVIIPPIIVATVWRHLFDQDNGAINMVLQGIGSLFKIPPDAFRIDWLGQVDDPIPFLPLPLAYFALLTANTWLGWPLNSVVATGALQSVPPDLYEAAEMDGANAWQRFKVVTLPFLRPAMLPYAIYGFVVTFNLFYLSYFMSNGGPFGRTELFVTEAYKLVNDFQLYGVAAAFSVILFFLLLGITLVTNRLARATAS
ncbi:MAG TPA: sugar ABC transporter permease, partial [Candidatus Limnocylindrales bacterium]|nr:sugar ABC transporter permease [Candidatus Limnocylindrales bacterium]